MKKLIIILIIGLIMESCTQGMSPYKAATKGGLRCGKGYVR